MSYEFYACDLVTGLIRESLGLVDVDATRSLSEAGAFKATMPLTGLHEDPDINLAIAGARLEAIDPENDGTIAIVRDGVCLGEWVVTATPDRRVGDSSVAIEGAHVRTFLSRVVPDMPFGGWSTPTEQLVIARYVALQAKDGSTPAFAPPGTRGIAITIPTPPASGVLRTRMADWTDGKFYSAEKLLNDLASDGNGFDWDIDVAVSGQSLVRTFRWGYPALGRSLGQDVRYLGEGKAGGSIIDFAMTKSSDPLATQVIGIGSGTGALRQVSRSSTVLAPVRALHQRAVSYSGVNVLNTLQQQSDADAAASVSALLPPSVVIDADGDVPLGSFSPGDSLDVIVNACPAYPRGWSGTVRILDYGIKPPATGVETVPLTVDLV